MKQGQLSRRLIIWSIVFWIATGSFLSISSAFLQDSRTTKPSRRNLVEGRSIALDSIPLLPQIQEGNGSIAKTKAIRRHTNSFGTISTRICMAGPVLDDEESGLVGESSLSSCSSKVVLETRCRGLAHGILCPETVTKMETATQGGRNNRAVKAFLERYHKHGPMSCMELLSDPEILPHLTSTMRGLV